MKNIKFFGLFSIVFLYIFGPVFRQIGNWFDLIFLTSISLSIYGIFFLKLNFPKYLRVFYLIFFVFTYLFISTFLSPFITNKELIRIALIPFRIIFTLYGGFVIIKLFIKNYPEVYFSKLLFTIFLTIFFHTLIMVLQFFIPSFKDFIYNYTSTGDFRGAYNYDFRMGGLTGSFGDSILSVVQSLGIVIIPWLTPNVNIFKKALFFVAGISIFFSILICGRSGIWSTLIFLPFSFYLSSVKKSWYYIFNFILKSIFLMFIFILIIFLFDQIDVNSPLFYALNRSLDTFLDYKESGSFNDHTFETVKTFILFPTDLIVFLFGDGEHFINTQEFRTLESDIGYIRNLWSMGIIVSLMFWTPILYYTIVAAKLSTKFKSAKLFFCVSFIILVFHAKENFLYVRMFHSIYALLLFLMFEEVKGSKLRIY